MSQALVTAPRGCTIRPCPYWKTCLDKRAGADILRPGWSRSRPGPLAKRNPAASVHDRLLALARDRSEDFQLLLARYGLEGLLYRLSQSRHRDRFVLNLAVVMKWS